MKQAAVLILTGRLLKNCQLKIFGWHRSFCRSLVAEPIVSARIFHTVNGATAVTVRDTCACPSLMAPWMVTTRGLTSGTVVCAGHSQWANRRHVKALKDSQKSKNASVITNKLKRAVLCRYKVQISLCPKG